MIDPEKEIHDLIESEPDYRDDDESRGHRRALRDVTKIAASREQYRPKARKNTCYSLVTEPRVILPAMGIS